MKCDNSNNHYLTVGIELNLVHWRLASWLAGYSLGVKLYLLFTKNTYVWTSYFQNNNIFRMKCEYFVCTIYFVVGIKWIFLETEMVNTCKQKLRIFSMNQRLVLSKKDVCINRYFGVQKVVPKVS